MIINIMRSIGLNGTVNFLNHSIPFKYFLEWPFFDDIKEHPKFAKAYSENFEGDQKLVEGISLKYFASENYRAFVVLVIEFFLTFLRGRCRLYPIFRSQGGTTVTMEILKITFFSLLICFVFYLL
mgnify:CR=1 FL=1